MTLKVTADPETLGFDPGRPARIDTRLARYVDEGRLAGWPVAVTRRGEVVHASTYGRRDLEADRPVEADTLWRIYSMTKPITSVAAILHPAHPVEHLPDPQPAAPARPPGARRLTDRPDLTDLI